MGLVFALLCIKSIGYLYNDKISEIGITLVAVYGSFILSEITVLKVSGVLAVTTVGLLVAGYGKIRVSSDIEQDLHTFWDILSYIAETAIFVLSGMIVVDKTKTDIEAIDWGYMIVGYAMVRRENISATKFVTVFPMPTFADVSNTLCDVMSTVPSAIPYRLWYEQA